MTTIAAYQGDGWAVIGSDSKSTTESGRFVFMGTPKIVKNGPYLIAGAGSVRGCNILQYGWTPPKPRGDLDKFMTKTFIPAMRKAFVEAGYDLKADSQAAGHDSEFIVVIHGRIYQISDDYSWERNSEPFYASGSGADYALGALKAFTLNYYDNDISAAIHMITGAIDIACQFDANSGGEIIIEQDRM